MLKAIVEHQYFSAQILKCPFAGGVSIRIRNDSSDSQEVLSKEKRFIPRLPLRSQQLISV
jgi:hypothetical protein